MTFKTTKYGDLTNKKYSSNFYIHNLELTSLEGSPKEVIGDFICKKNRLTSLEGSPEIIKGDFNYSYNNLINLKGSPRYIEGDFDLRDNNLTSLIGCPKDILENFYININELKSLKHCPKEIRGIFDCSSNNLTSLEYRPKLSQTFACRNNPELKNVKEQIIKYGIKAERYITDIGDFKFSFIKEEFEEYNKKLKIVNKNLLEKDYGLGI